MSSVAGDVRFGFRILRKDAKFTLLAVLYLALGIGGNTVLFSVFNSVLLDALPYRDAERLVVIWDTYQQAGGEPLREIFTTPPSYFARKAQSSSFEGMGALLSSDFVLTGGGEPELIEGAAMTADLMPLLGVKPMLGRLVSPEEDRPGGGNRVVVLGHGLWSNRFGSDRTLIGRTLTLNGESYTVIGVLPPDFQSPIRQAQLWVPLGLDPADVSVTQRQFHHLSMLGRLKPDATVERAQAELDAVAQRMAEVYPDSNLGWTAEIISLRDYLIGDIRPRLIALQVAASLFLLIVCANLANLALVRADSYTHEIVVRTALGATRRQLLVRLLTESLILTVISGIVGTALALLLVKSRITGVLFKNLLTSSTTVEAANFFQGRSIELDGRVLAVTLGFTLLVGLVLGLIPALKVLRSNLIIFMKGEGKATASARRHRLLDTLAVSEITLAMVLLVGAGLVVKSFESMSRVDPGFRYENALFLRFKLPPFAYPTGQHRQAFQQRTLQRLHALPSVRSAGYTTTMPLKRDDEFGRFTVKDRPAASDSEVLFARFALISPRYLGAMGIPILEGREFRDGDAENASGVVIVSKSMAERYWPNQSPIGRQLQRSRRPTPDLPWLTVVGVAGDVIYGDAATGTEPAFYLPFAQHAEQVLDLSNKLNLVVRSDADADRLQAAVLAEIRAVDPNLPVPEVTSLKSVVASSLSQHQSSMLLITLFSGLALLVAVLGIYGVISYFVSQRTREIGIRMALGARSVDILKRVLGRGAVLTLCGLGLGIAGATLMTRLLKTQLYGIESLEFLVLLGAGLGLITVSLVASYVPARRAAKTDPNVTLRYE